MFLNDSNQQTASSELKKTVLKSETTHFFLKKFEIKHNAEPSQCITKFTTDDRQYL